MTLMSSCFPCLCLLSFIFLLTKRWSQERIIIVHQEEKQNSWCSFDNGIDMETFFTSSSSPSQFMHAEYHTSWGYFTEDSQRHKKVISSPSLPVEWFPAKSDTLCQFSFSVSLPHSLKHCGGTTHPFSSCLEEKRWRSIKNEFRNSEVTNEDDTRKYNENVFLLLYRQEKVTQSFQKPDPIATHANLSSSQRSSFSSLLFLSQKKGRRNLRKILSLFRHHLLQFFLTSSFSCLGQVSHVCLITFPPIFPIKEFGWKLGKNNFDVVHFHCQEYSSFPKGASHLDDLAVNFPKYYNKNNPTGTPFTLPLLIFVWLINRLNPSLSVSENPFWFPLPLPVSLRRKETKGRIPHSWRLSLFSFSLVLPKFPSLGISFPFRLVFRHRIIIKDGCGRERVSLHLGLICFPPLISWSCKTPEIMR